MLDIGCGTGQLARDLFHRGYEVIGIDLSEAAIDLARSSTIYSGKGINFEVNDFMDFESGSKSFDLVTAKYVIAFIADKKPFIEKIFKILKPDGKLIIISPNPETTPPQKMDICINRDEFLELLHSVFDKTKFEEIGTNHIFVCTK